MHTIRIIPRIDIKGPNLVKGIHLEGLRVLGKPEDFARYYYEQGADELIYMDVVASLYNRNSLHDIISRTAQEIFIPLTVGGGIRSIEDIKAVLRAGADKVSLNTAAIKTPELISEAVNKFGSSTITVSIEALRQPDNRYLAFTDNGREYTGVEVIEWAQQIESLGAGEIVITSIDREGTGLGFDVELTQAVSQAVSIPVIASGGAGSIDHLDTVITEGRADAVAVASMLHYHYISKHRETNNFEGEGNIEFLRSTRLYNKITPTTITQIKKTLGERTIPTRQ